MELSILTARARALARIRRFFSARGYLEVDTPLLAPALIPESTLEVFAVQGLPGPRYLIPSPELWMKRLLCAGSGSVFQLCRAFRSDEPDSPLHLPEFTMLEWYTVDTDYLGNVSVQESLIAELCQELRLPGLPASETVSDCRPPFLRVRMAEAFREQLGLDLAARNDRESLGREAAARGLAVDPQDDWADLFHKLFLAFVEPNLPRDRPVFVTDYPRQVPTLARSSPASPWAERWELYIAGVEIANCYTEERDPARVEAFFRGQEAARGAARRSHPVDWELARLIPRALPPCSGVALGVERLLAVLLGLPCLGAVTPFADCR
ncbi:MAG: elongation factor P--(R)-beta-lysine ligase [Spirochaetales bacterium]|nr:elongation factor P--(R)-beta-lysine ligase [Spirochaetales bacterium]